MKGFRILGMPNDLDIGQVETAGDLSRKKGRPIRLARSYRRPEWKASMPLYVLWCHDCRCITVTYPAGRGRIDCGQCRGSHRVWTSYRTRHQIIQPLVRAVMRLVLILLISAVVFHLLH